MKNLNFLSAFFVAASLAACNDDLDNVPVVDPIENPSSFAEIGQIDLGDEGAAEISAYDAVTKRLFVVNNSSDSRVEVIDLSDPANPVLLQNINVSANVNSVSTYNGLVAAAVEGATAQQNGKVVFVDAQTLAVTKEVGVGALPDMLTFSPDGKYVLVANEGEPSDDYLTDPEGSVTIITLADYSVKTLGFGSFENSRSKLEANGYRVFGPNASFAQDTEPEYITVSDDSQYAWVSLQENNAIAKIDLNKKAITSIFPMGTKDFNNSPNQFDVSDKDNMINLSDWPVKSFYMPDALAWFSVNGMDYVITANEGDSRDYEGYSEETRVKDITLDASVFPNASFLQAEDQLGRLKITISAGNTDTDDEYEELYAFGGRSFSIWNGDNGQLIYDSGNQTELILQQQSSLYPDDRSDDKGSEPEGVAVGKIRDKTLAFIGLERADAVLVYDVNLPEQPQFLQLLQTGDAPEGIQFIPASNSPNGRSMLIVSSEGDGVVKIFQPEIQ